MKTRISRQFFAHYLVVSLLVLLSTVLALSFLAIASRWRPVLCHKKIPARP